MTPEKSIEEIIRDEAEIEMQGFEYRASLEEFAKRAYIKGRSAQIEAEKQKDERIKELEDAWKIANALQKSIDRLQKRINELELSILTYCQHLEKNGTWYENPFYSDFKQLLNNK